MQCTHFIARAITWSHPRLPTRRTSHHRWLDSGFHSVSNHGKILEVARYFVYFAECRLHRSNLDQQLSGDAIFIQVASS